MVHSPPTIHWSNIKTRRLDIALKRFTSLEKKLNKSLELKAQYAAFMDEFSRLGHMTKVDVKLRNLAILYPTTSSSNQLVQPPNCTWCLTHTARQLQGHPSTTYRLQIQPSNWNYFPSCFVFVADIEKMCRQIWIHEDDQPFQTVWRNGPSKNIRVY